MTSKPYEHDSAEDAQNPIRGKPLSEPREPLKRELHRQAMRDVQGNRPWLRWDNPALWTGTFDEDGDDEEREQTNTVQPRYRTWPSRS